MDVTLAGWAATLALVAALLAVDLLVADTGEGAAGFRAAVGWSVFYTAAAVAFGLAFGLVAGWEFGGEYFAGYIVERSLSIDNLFVFVIIFSTFAVPAEHQPKALTYGIIAALVLRAIFIGL